MILWYHSPMLRRIEFLLCCASLLLTLSACGKPKVPPLPKGEQIVSGLLQKSPLSLTRRGTHVLIQSDAPVAYLESATINLSLYEERVADVTGTYEPNVDPRDLPVIVVTAVKAGQEQNRAYSIPVLGITLEVPREWKGAITGEDAQFTASGSVNPLLSLFLEGEENLISSSRAGANLTDVPVAVGGRSGVRWKNAQTGVERMQVDLRPFVTNPKSDVLTFLFTPGEEAQNQPDAWEAVKEDIFRSVTFTENGSSVSSALLSNSSPLGPVSGSGAGSPFGSAQGMPCGGTAGILCPTGLYCEITDVAANVGRCKGVR